MKTLKNLQFKVIKNELTFKITGGDDGQVEKKKVKVKSNGGDNGGEPQEEEGDDS